MFEYDFILRAVIVGVLVSLCASLLGVSLVLKRFAMIGDGLSHVGFGALCIAAALNFAPLEFSIPLVIIAAFFLLKISENGKIKGDSAIALISATSLAVGVIITSFTKGANVDVFNFMFGSILAMTMGDVIVSVCVALVVLFLFIICYHKIFLITFDESFAWAMGVKVDLYKMLLAILTAVIIVVGMRIMGALLISSLVIFPSLTSMRVFKTFKNVVISSGIIAVTCFIIGIGASYSFSLPAGASVVAVNAIAFCIFALLGKFKKAGAN